MDSLTERQRQILRYLCHHLVEKQRAPAIRELMEHLGIASTNGVHDHLKALEKKGFLLRPREKHHGLRILKDEDNRVPVIRFVYGGR